MANLTLIHIMSGAIAMGFATAGVFFLRFWWESRDRLFALFAVAFFALAVGRVLLSVLHDLGEQRILLYVIRLAAFLLILAAMLDKNLRRPQPAASPESNTGRMWGCCRRAVVRISR